MKNKLLALKLLKQKIHDPSLTFSLISEKTGYSKRQLIREDVLNDPAKSDVVARYHLRPRSLSWFRSLFIQQIMTSSMDIA